MDGIFTVRFSVFGGGGGGALVDAAAVRLMIEGTKRDIINSNEAN